MKFYPNIFIVKNEYHFVIIPKNNAQVSIKIDGKRYYEVNGGIIPTADDVHKIIIPQSVLDKAGKYAVIIRDVIDKKTYFPEFKEEVEYQFDFKNDSVNNLKAYYLADIHGMYEIAKNLVKPHNGVDFIIINGDYGECDKKEDIYRLNEFIGQITLGSIPVLFVRGNHDTRGRFAEYLYKYVGMDGQKGYFKFNFRSLSGLALDCGEDKWDSSIEYNYSNVFEDYRKQELKFIKNAKFSKDKYLFAVSHTSFMLKNSMNGIFDIDYATYNKWAKALNSKGLNFMLCGHIHYFLVSPPSEADHQPHNYPVITGSQVSKDYKNLYGTLIEFSNGKTTFTFLGEDGEAFPKYVVNA